MISTGLWSFSFFEVLFLGTGTAKDNCKNESEDFCLLYRIVFQNPATDVIRVGTFPFTDTMNLSIGTLLFTGLRDIDINILKKDSRQPLT